jgi:hypothetical protein
MYCTFYSVLSSVPCSGYCCVYTTRTQYTEVIQFDDHICLIITSYGRKMFKNMCETHTKLCLTNNLRSVTFTRLCCVYIYEY